MKPKRYTPDKERTMLFIVQGGRCKCGVKLVTGPPANYIIEHDVPLGLGGEDVFDNKSLLCITCAAAKTFHPRSLATTLGSDIANIAKAKRIAKGGKKRKGRKMQGRKFTKTHRPLRP